MKNKNSTGLIISEEFINHFVRSIEIYGIREIQIHIEDENVVIKCTLKYLKVSFNAIVSLKLECVNPKSIVFSMMSMKPINLFKILKPLLKQSNIVKIDDGDLIEIVLAEIPKISDLFKYIVIKDLRLSRNQVHVNLIPAQLSEISVQ